MMDDVGAKGAIDAGDSGNACGQMKGIDGPARHLDGEQMKPLVADGRAMAGDAAGDADDAPHRLERACQPQPVGAEIPVLGDEK